VPDVRPPDRPVQISAWSLDTSHTICQTWQRKIGQIDIKFKFLNHWSTLHLIWN